MITVNEKDHVLFDGLYIGKILQQGLEGISFISAYVGGIQHGTCLEDIYQFALRYINRVFVEPEDEEPTKDPSTKKKPKKKTQQVKRYSESRIRKEAEFFGLSSKKITWFLKKKPTGESLGEYWKKEKVRLIKSFCRGRKEPLPRGYASKALKLLGIPPKAISSPKELVKLLKGI